jgi:hypothetical protein
VVYRAWPGLGDLAWDGLVKGRLHIHGRNTQSPELARPDNKVGQDSGVERLEFRALEKTIHHLFGAPVLHGPYLVKDPPHACLEQ